MLACPLCGHTESDVIDSRTNSMAIIIRRRRTCRKCHERFTTYEMAVDPMVFEAQRDRAKAIARQLRDMALALEVW
jgi:transcriptional repressor NrdR